MNVASINAPERKCGAREHDAAQACGLHPKMHLRFRFDLPDGDHGWVGVYACEAHVVRMLHEGRHKQVSAHFLGPNCGMPGASWPRGVPADEMLATTCVLVGIPVLTVDV